MTSTASEIEQFRPGFEAWALNRVPGHKLTRKETGEYLQYATQCAWVAWAEAKREASTEQSDVARLLSEARAVLETWKDVVPAVSLCADIDKVLAGRCRAQGGVTSNESGNSGAAPGDALDAALWKFLVKSAQSGELVLWTDDNDITIVDARGLGEFGRNLIAGEVDSEWAKAWNEFRSAIAASTSKSDATAKKGQI